MPFFFNSCLFFLLISQYFLWYFCLMVTKNKDAHVWSNLCYLICLRHLIKTKTVTNKIWIRPIFFHACATCFELPSNISTMLFLSFFCNFDIKSALISKLGGFALLHFLICLDLLEFQLNKGGQKIFFLNLKFVLTAQQ